ncbi:hypothetical protein PAL_GLEAN10022848 [Pteropus alecto]|uniref:Uncharacterized protein n=1 Tax=Pteropus alecto TaxID=9402 RepID=L5K4S8_PTEAL|nr:hypothetical protein PAL_GLEAN10022848 [Pteropus alecto]
MQQSSRTKSRTPGGSRATKGPSSIEPEKSFHLSVIPTETLGNNVRKERGTSTFLEHHCAGDVGPDWQCLSFPVPPGDTQGTSGFTCPKKTPQGCAGTQEPRRQNPQNENDGEGASLRGVKHNIHKRGRP